MLPEARRWIAALVGWWLLLVCSSSIVNAADVPGRLLVGQRRGTDSVTLARTFLSHRATVRRQLPELAASILEVPESATAEIQESLLASGLFEYVERDHYAHSAGVPNDPAYLDQWHLPQIHSPEAWNVTTGAPSIVVAVVDSGVYAQHPDLAAKLIPGWNFVKSTVDTSDVLGHGTAVAGTIAASTNNALGVSAVTWGSVVMPLVVVDENDFAAYSNIAAAIQYAADRGVRIINISIGGGSPSALLQSAVDYAWARGAVVFASAMNEGTAQRYYPAACNHVVAVAATDSVDHLAGFSNYGDWITLAAPGTNILTTANYGGYGYWSGTSFSSPIVAGVAALVLAANPSLSGAELITLLERTADDLGNPGFDSSFGWGRVNAYAAVAAARQLLNPPVSGVHGPARPSPARGR